MVDTKEKIDDIVEQFKQERDELRLKLHLAKEDLGDEWDKLEASLAKLESKAKHVGGATLEASSDVGAAAKLLAEEIQKGFTKIRRHF
jgi:hypothetical protein